MSSRVCKLSQSQRYWLLFSFPTFGTEDAYLLIGVNETTYQFIDAGCEPGLSRARRMTSMSIKGNGIPASNRSSGTRNDPAMGLRRTTMKHSLTYTIAGALVAALLTSTAFADTIVNKGALGKYERKGQFLKPIMSPPARTVGGSYLFGRSASSFGNLTATVSALAACGKNRTRATDGLHDRALSYKTVRVRPLYGDFATGYRPRILDTFGRAPCGRNSLGGQFPTIPCQET